MENSLRVGSIVGKNLRQSKRQHQKWYKKHSRKQQVTSSCSMAQMLWIAFALVISLFCFLLASANLVDAETTASQSTVSSDSSGKSSYSAQKLRQQDEQKSALEVELNSIVQQHDALDGGKKLLAEAIISSLLVDNLTGSSLPTGNSGDVDSEFLNAINGGESTVVPGELVFANSDGSYGSTDALMSPDPQTTNLPMLTSVGFLPNGPSGPEAMRLKKLLSLLKNYETIIGPSGGQAYDQYPTMPSGEVATMKRAALKVNNFLQTQQHYQPRQMNYQGYTRNNFDFGLGKRPDYGFTSKISRFGDSFGINGGQVQAVSQFGKRPSAHRYDFGLGKRVASPAYPRYDFGLGKRAPSRIRYDFGLGK